MQEEYRVVLTNEAKADIIEIARYYIALGLYDTCSKLLNQLYKDINSLSFLPHRFALVEENKLHKSDIRRMISGRLLVFFYIDDLDSVVTVIGVLAAKQNQWSL